nr:MAG TPA: hypothetical protein [Caudoviricetes sp.]
MRRNARAQLVPTNKKVLTRYAKCVIIYIVKERT